ncbi:hypothetical protein CH313_14760 [Streptomyces sp. TSRI0384-2]|nr:hypothetical protein CH313_14760 [Streptomyces sp. TSRI0384-2]
MRAGQAGGDLVLVMIEVPAGGPADGMRDRRGAGDHGRVAAVRRSLAPGRGTGRSGVRALRWRTRSVGPKLETAPPGQHRGAQVRFAALTHVSLYSNVELTSVGKWPPHSPETGHLRAEAGSRP